MLKVNNIIELWESGRESSQYHSIVESGLMSTLEGLYLCLGWRVETWSDENKDRNIKEKVMLGESQMGYCPLCFLLFFVMIQPRMVLIHRVLLGEIKHKSFLSLSLSFTAKLLQLCYGAQCL